MVEWGYVKEDEFKTGSNGERKKGNRVGTGPSSIYWTGEHADNACRTAAARATEIAGVCSTRPADDL